MSSTQNVLKDVFGISSVQPLSIDQALRLDNLGSIRIIANFYLTEPTEPVPMMRTMRERLFSLPWRPLQRIKLVEFVVPSKKIYWLEDNNALIMHPNTAKEFRRAISTRVLNQAEKIQLNKEANEGLDGTVNR